MSKWFYIKSPFKVTSKITVADDGVITAIARPTKIHDPLGILPLDFESHSNSASAKCHPDDTYDRGYGVRLAGNRARYRLYEYAANQINKKLEQLDTYLSIIHNKMVGLNAERDALLLEQMDIKELPTGGQKED